MAPPPNMVEFSSVAATEEKQRTTLTFDITLPLQVYGNPAGEPGGSTAAGYFGPSGTLALSVPDIVGGWALSAVGGSDADLFSRKPDDLDETRVTGELSIGKEWTRKRQNAAGAVVEKKDTLSLGIREKVAYLGPGYGRFNYAMERYFLSFGHDLSTVVNIGLIAEYRASGKPEQRSAVTKATFNWTLLDKPNVLKVAFGQELSLYLFRAGANKGRNDYLSQSGLTITPVITALPKGFELSMSAVFIHRFSNRATARFSDIEIGPVLTKKF